MGIAAAAVAVVLFVEVLDVVSAVADFGIPEDAFASAEEQSSEDGTRVITAKAPGQALEDLCLGFLGSIDSITGVTNEYSLSDVTVVLTINPDGFLTDIKLDYSASFDFLGSASAAIVGVEVRYTDVSGAATVTAPEGVEAYPDYDPSTMTDDNTSSSEPSETDEMAIEAAFALFEEDHHTHVANYDELYAKACEEFGKETIDSIVEIIEVFGAVAAGS